MPTKYYTKALSIIHSHSQYNFAARRVVWGVGSMVGWMDGRPNSVGSWTWTELWNGSVVEVVVQAQKRVNGFAAVPQWEIKWESVSTSSHSTDGREVYPSIDLYSGWFKWKIQHDKDAHKILATTRWQNNRRILVWILFYCADELLWPCEVHWGVSSRYFVVFFSKKVIWPTIESGMHDKN